MGAINYFTSDYITLGIKPYSAAGKGIFPNFDNIGKSSEEKAGRKSRLSHAFILHHIKA